MLPRFLEYAKRYREKHPEKIKESGEKYRLSHPEVRKDWEKANPLRKRFNSLKGAASKRKIEFSLKFENIYWPTHCPILGIEINYSLHDGRKSNGPSFDRIDPGKGYIHENTRVVSYRGNVIKNDGNLEEHKAIVRYLELCKNQLSLPKLLRVS